MNAAIAPKRLKTVDVVDLAALELPPPSFTVEHIAPVSGVVLLTGDSGSCKSSLNFHMAVSLALGVPVGGRFAVAKDAGPVLYVNGEMNPTVLQASLRAAAAGYGRRLDEIGRDRVVFVGPDGLTGLRFSFAGGAEDNDHRGKFINTIEKLRPSIVILDTQRALFDLDEKDASQVREEFQWLRVLAVDYACCIMVVHHLRKTNAVANGARDRVSGSTDLVAVVDVHLSARSNGGRPMHALLLDKTRYAVDGVQAGTEWPVTPVFEPPTSSGDPGRSSFIIGAPAGPDAALESSSSALRDILARFDAEGPLTRGQLGADDRGSGNLKRAFREGAARRQIVKTGKKSGRSDLWDRADRPSDERDLFEPGLEHGLAEGHDET